MKDLIFTRNPNCTVYCSICGQKILKNVYNYKLTNYCMKCYNTYMIQEAISGEQK